MSSGLKAKWQENATEITDKESFIEICDNEQKYDSIYKLQLWAKSELLNCGNPLANLATVLHDMCQKNSRFKEINNYIPVDVCKEEIKKAYKFKIQDHDIFDQTETDIRADKFKNLFK